MEFEYTGCFYVSEDDLNEMAILVRGGRNVKNAIYDIASGWDDEAYYSVNLIIDKLIEEVLRRAKE